jgi:TonB family protein
VQLSVTVRADGSVQDVLVVTGHALLNDAAVKAVQQWKFATSAFGGTVHVDVPFVLPAPMTGIVTGRVIDAEGRPMAGVRVGIRGIGYADGKRASLLGIGALGSVRTDTDGLYTLPVSVAGEYHVLASYDIPANAVAGSPAETLSPQTYHPGTPDLFAAVPVSIKLNATVIADIRVPRVETVRVAGKILLPVLAESPGETIEIRLVRIGDARFADESVAADNVSRENRTEVPFEFRVRPGIYFVTAVIGAGPPHFAYSARLDVDARNLGVENLSLSLQRNIEFKGRILSDDPGTRFETLRVGLLGKEGSIGGGVYNVEGDGSVRLFNLPKANYNVEVRGLTGNSYVSEIRSGAVSVYEEGVVSITDKPPDDLVISVRAKGGVVEGVVRTALRQPVGAAHVILVPEGSRRRQNPSFYKRANADAAGGFRFGGIAPGEYKVFGFEVTPPNGGMQNAEFIAQYENNGVRVVVREGLVSPTLGVQIIPKS